MPDTDKCGTSTPPRGAASHGTQNTWLARARGQRVKVRFTDGRSISGQLASWDTYCIGLEPGTGPPVLVFKTAIAYLAIDGGEGVRP